MKSISDQELMKRIRSFEDNLVERKTYNDSKDWLKTVTAFANSVPLDAVGVLFIGVRDNGTVEKNQDLDKVQKSLNQILAKAYPPIRYSTRILSFEESTCLAVLVPGSPGRPHFAGPAYIRVGSETKNASKSEFDRLIAERNSKTYALQHAGENNVRLRWQKEPEGYDLLGLDKSTVDWTVESCDQFTVTLNARGRGATYHIPLSRIEISRDFSGRMLLEVFESPRNP